MQHEYSETMTTEWAITISI